MKANTHLEVPAVNWAIIHTTLAGSSLLPPSQNQQQQAVGVLRPGACGELGSRGQAERGHGCPGLRGGGSPARCWGCGAQLGGGSNGRTPVNLCWVLLGAWQAAVLGKAVQAQLCSVTLCSS